jgi:hypothetical protein
LPQAAQTTTGRVYDRETDSSDAGLQSHRLQRCRLGAPPRLASPATDPVHRVDDDRALHDRGATWTASVEREEERDPTDEVWRDEVRQQAPLGLSFPDETHVSQAQVAEPAVDEFEEALEVAPPKSPASTSATGDPRGPRAQRCLHR